LVGDEIEAAPKSTVSGWHTKGLERLAETFLQREKNLSAQNAEPSALLDPDLGVSASEEAKSSYARLLQHPIFMAYRQYHREFWLGLAFIIIIFVGWKSWRILSLYRAFKQDVSQFQVLVTEDVSLEALSDVGPLLTKTREDVLALQRHIAPFGWAGRLVGWLPVYGGDLAYAEPLLDLAAGLVIAGDEAYQGLSPLLDELQSGGQRPPIPAILDTLDQAQPRFEIAQQFADQALAARDQIRIERLSAKTRPYLEKIDPFLPLLGEGMAALQVLPKLAGAGEYGPQTYMLLIQNEDELRATGGFITGVGTVTIERGNIISFVVEDSYAFDDFSKLYPAPPWQFQEFMLGGAWLLRDSNWSPDFPTTATWSEHFYAYSSGHSVNGVLAMGQQVMRLLLTVLGPIELEGTNELITAENVVDYIRFARGTDLTDEEWNEAWDNRKDFMAPLAQALLSKILEDPDVDWFALGKIMLQVLDERYVLVQIDDPTIGAIIKKQGWDGALYPRAGDFIMVVDSNLGFNKANAAAKTEIKYQVDLTNFENLYAKLSLTHQNPTKGDEPCIHGSYNTQDYAGLIARCYWNYVRVYTLADAELLEATPHLIPGEWLLGEKDLPARVDVLDNKGIVIENPKGLQAYGTMVVVPLTEERHTSFDFALPGTVLIQNKDDTWTYHLHVQKQAGTSAVPFMLSVNLPDGARIINAEPQGVVQGNHWQADLKILTDLDISLTWKSP